VLDGAREAFTGITIHMNVYLLIQTHDSEVGLRHIGLHPEIIGAKDTHDDLIGGNEISFAHAEYLDHGLLWRTQTSFAELGLDLVQLAAGVGESGFGLGDILRAIAVLELERVGARALQLGSGFINVFLAVTGHEQVESRPSRGSPRQRAAILCRGAIVVGCGAGVVREREFRAAEFLLSQAKGGFLAFQFRLGLENVLLARTGLEASVAGLRCLRSSLGCFSFFGPGTAAHPVERRACGPDVGQRLLVLGFQLGSLQTHKHLPGADEITFSDQDLRDTASDLGAEAHFLHLNRPLQTELAGALP
jgi:hypothetical protein